MSRTAQASDGKNEEGVVDAVIEELVDGGVAATDQGVGDECGETYRGEHEERLEQPSGVRRRRRASQGMPHLLSIGVSVGPLKR